MKKVGDGPRAARRGFRRLGRVAAVALAALALSATAVEAQDAGADLPSGRPVARELAGGANHTYTLTLEAGQFLHLVVEQQGVDVTLTLRDARGVSVAEVDSPNGAWGPERLFLIVDVGGAYRLEVSASTKEAKPGRYEAKIEELRATTARDRRRVEAFKLFAEAEGWNVAQTKEAARAALKQYEAALLIWREADDRARAAETLYAVGQLQQKTGEARLALAAHEEALALWRELGESAREADAHFAVGLARQQLGETQTALEAFTRSLTLSREAGDRRRASMALNRLGVLHVSLGNMRLALQHHADALALLREINDLDGQATTLASLALLYTRLGEPERARELNLQALELVRLLHDRRNEQKLLGNIGTGYIRAGEYEKAIEYLKQALALSRELGDRTGEGIVLSSLGAAHARRGEFPQALDCLEKSLALSRATGDRVGDGYTLHSIASIHRRLGDHARAFDLYTESLAVRRAVGDRHGEHQTLAQLARLEADRNRLDAARGYAEQALEVAESLRADIPANELRAAFFATVQEYYDLYVGLLMRQHMRDPRAGHDIEALRASERKRARSLLDVLAEAGTDIRRDLPAPLLEREREARRKVNARAAALSKLNAMDAAPEVIRAAGRALDEAIIERQAVEAQIRGASPRYAALAHPTPPDLKQIQTELLAADTALVEYTLGAERSFAFVVTTTTFDAFELPKASAIESAAREVYGLLTARYPVPKETPVEYARRVAEADARFEASAAALSRMVLAPLAARLDKMRLLIVADGGLQYVPFAALPEPLSLRSEADSGSPLILSHEIVSLPSAAALAAIRRDAGPRGKSAAVSVAVFADPVFDAGDARVKRRMGDAAPALRATLDAAPDGGLRRLVFSREEAAAIVSLAGASSSRRFLDFDASRAAATGDELARFPFIHFATHSFVDGGQPELSGIVLSLVDERGRPQDGLLRLQDIYQMRLPVELVTLSACRTAIGREVRGEGLMSLTRGFMYAGARRVAASLWKVDDAATAELMESFYRHLLTAPAARRPTPAAALRRAQLELMRRPNRRAPFYWAAFTLQGEWR
jgi:CHAT domain-containing protein/tetratricopeptide (TPR) repeat protein